MKVSLPQQKRLTGQITNRDSGGGYLCLLRHVDYTGEIGVIKVLSLMNYKGGVRFSMLCGDRALEVRGEDGADADDL